MVAPEAMTPKIPPGRVRIRDIEQIGDDRESKGYNGCECGLIKREEWNIFEPPSSLA